jgi:hypothetical protein
MLALSLFDRSRVFVHLLRAGAVFPIWHMSWPKLRWQEPFSTLPTNVIAQSA